MTWKYKPRGRQPAGQLPALRHGACLILEHPHDIAAPRGGIAAVLRRGSTSSGFGEMQKDALMIPAFIKKALRYGLVLTALLAPFEGARSTFAQG